MKHLSIFKKVIIAGSALFIINTSDAQSGNNADYATVTLSKLKPAGSRLPFAVSIIPDSSGEKITIIVSNPENKKMLLTVNSVQYGNIFTQEIKEPRYAKRLDMTLAEDGDYEIELSCGKDKYSKRIAMNTYTETTRKIKMK
ncbi:MAG: hypothetical protein WDO19_27410 [Bacteroidota bacterium]